MKESNRKLKTIKRHIDHQSNPCLNFMPEAGILTEIPFCLPNEEDMIFQLNIMVPN